MKLEAGKTYRTRGGHLAVNIYPFFTGVSTEWWSNTTIDGYMPMWTAEGECAFFGPLGSRFPEYGHLYDLVEEAE